MTDPGELFEQLDAETREALRRKLAERPSAPAPAGNGFGVYGAGGTPPSPVPAGVPAIIEGKLHPSLWNRLPAHLQQRFIDELTPAPPPPPPADPPPAQLLSADSGNGNPGTPWLSVDSSGNLYVYGNLIQAQSGSTGTLFYSPSPGPETLVLSISPTAGVDQYGNPYTAGAATYSNLPGGAVFAISNLGGALLMQEYSNGTWIGLASLGYVSSQGLYVSQAPLMLALPVVAQQPGTSPPVAETWHAMTLQNSWATVSTWTVPSYMLTADGNVRLAGRAAQASDGTQVIATLPAAYTPTTKQVATCAVPSGTITAGQTPRLQLGTDGTIAAFGVTGATTVTMDGITFPLSLNAPAPPPQTIGLLGATIADGSFGGFGTNYPTQANLWDGYFTGGNAFNCPAPAATCQKTYYKTGSQNWGSGLPARDSAYITLGAHLVVSLKPWQAVGDNYTSSSNLCSNKKQDNGTVPPPPGWTIGQELAALQTQIGLYIGQWAGAATKLDIILWQEANDGQSFTNGATYVRYLNFYKTAIQHYAANNVGIVVNVGFGGGNFSAYNPGPTAGATEFLLDYYGDAYKNDQGAALATCAGIAQAMGVPFGLSEWGASASEKPQTNFTAYAAALQAFFVNLAKTQPVGKIIYFNDVNGSPNVVTGPTDPKVAPIAAFYNAVFAA